MSDLYPDAVGFDVSAVHIFTHEGEIDLLPGDFSVEDVGDHYVLTLGPKSPTSNLPLHSRIDFSAIYFKDGKPFRFEDHDALHLYYTAQWTVENSRGHRTSIGPGKGAEMRDFGGHVSNWSPRYEQTGGMDPTLKLSAEANDEILSVSLNVLTPDGLLMDKRLILPKAS